LVWKMANRLTPLGEFPLAGFKTVDRVKIAWSADLGAVVEDRAKKSLVEDRKKVSAEFGKGLEDIMSLTKDAWDDLLRL